MSVKHKLGERLGTLAIEVPEPRALPGSAVHGKLVLSLARESAMRRIGAVLWGGEFVHIHDSSSTLEGVSYPVERTGSLGFLRAPAELRALSPGVRVPAPGEGPLTLAQGRYRFAFTAALPAPSPPSWDGPSRDVEVRKTKAKGGISFTYVGVKYEVRAGADVGRFGALSAVEEVQVVEPPQVPVFKPGRSLASRGRRGGPALTLSLDFTQATAGAVLQGAVRLEGSSWKRVRKIRLTLFEKVVGHAGERLGAAKRWERRPLSEATLLPPPTPEGMRAAFALRVPLGTCATRRGEIASRLHWVEARADLALARDLTSRVDVVVLSREAVTPPPP